MELATRVIKKIEKSFRGVHVCPRLNSFYVKFWTFYGVKTLSPIALAQGIRALVG